MFKTGVTILLALCVASSAWAQQAGPGQQTRKPPAPQQRAPQPKPEKPVKPPKPPAALPQYIQNPDATVERLRKTFRLTDGQVFELRTLVNTRNREVTQALEEGNDAQFQKREVQSIQDRFQRDVRGLLTTEQAARFDTEVLAKPGTFR